MLLRKPFVNRRRKKKSGLAVDRTEMAHQCSAQALENQFHNDSLRHAQTIKSDRLLACCIGKAVIGVPALHELASTSFFVSMLVGGPRATTALSVLPDIPAEGSRA